MKIFFARHGESQANVLREISNRGLKHPLTQTGRDQALSLANRLQRWSITRIYSSPLLRAIETSVIVASSLDVEYEIQDALREYDVGILEGRADTEAWATWQNLFDNWTNQQQQKQKIDCGEGFDEVKNRFFPFIENLVGRFRNTDANLLCIAHGGLYTMMLPLVLKNIDTQFIQQRQGFPYTSMIIS